MADKLALSLFLIRISTGLMFLVWSVQKILRPDLAQGVFKTFYLFEVTPTLLLGLGVAQTAVVLAFMAGLWKRVTYGAILAMHLVSTLSTWERLIDPYTRPNALFWAAVPVLAALIGLYLLRDEDRLLSVGVNKGAKS